MGIFSNLFKKKDYDEELKNDALTMEQRAQVQDSTGLNTGDFVFEIEDVFTITGRGTVVTGKVISGRVILNDEVYVGNIKTTVTGIEMFRKSLDYAETGDNAGLLLRDISRDMIKKGDIIKK